VIVELVCFGCNPKRIRGWYEVIGIIEPIAGRYVSVSYCVCTGRRGFAVHVEDDWLEFSQIRNSARCVSLV